MPHKNVKQTEEEFKPTPTERGLAMALKNVTAENVRLRKGYLLATLDTAPSYIPKDEQSYGNRALNYLRNSLRQFREEVVTPSQYVELIQQAVENTGQNQEVGMKDIIIDKLTLITTTALDAGKIFSDALKPYMPET